MDFVSGLMLQVPHFRFLLCTVIFFPPHRVAHAYYYQEARRQV